MIRSLRSHALATTAAFALTALAAQPAAAAQQRTFNVPPERAADSLPEFARQAGLQIIVSDRHLPDVRTPAITGQQDARTALRTLIAGTGLAIASDNGATIILKPAGEVARPQVEAAARPTAVDELVVTGSRIATPGAPVAPVKVYDAQAIARSGQTDLRSFLNTLPEVSVNSLGNSFTSYGGQDYVRLRGLPVGSTLMLLDGRRLATSATGSNSGFDINLLPTALVERVDVVPVGSSAVYGSDAIGGVVNVITRQRYSGVRMEAGYSVADQFESKRVSALAGAAFGRLSVVVAATASQQDALYGFDRPLTANNDFTRFAALGGQDFRALTCNPGTVTAVSGVLRGVGTATAGMPADGSNAPSAYVANQTNRCSPYARSPLVPRQKNGSLALNAQYELANGFVLYSQNIYAVTTNDARQAGRTVTNQLVPASNAYNPFGQDVRVNTLIPTPSGTRYASRLYRPLLGLRGNLPGNWNFDATSWVTRLREKVMQDGIGLQPNLPALLAVSTPGQTLNVFQPATNSPAILRSAYAYIMDRSRVQDAVGTIVLRGEALDLPAGPLQLAFGGEMRHETYRSQAYNGGSLAQSLAGSGKRNGQAVFLEAEAPLLSRADGEPLLSLNAAGRYDHFSDFGEAFTPQLGLRFRPAKDLLFRATYSEAFKAPSLQKLHLSSSVTEANIGVLDPLRNEATGQIRFSTGGNPDLKAETGKSYSAGGVWTPEAIGGLELSATWWRITQENRLVVPGTAAIIANEALFPGRVTRAPSTDGRPGVIQGVDFSYMNFGGLKAEGVDLGLRYRWTTDHGVVTPSINLSRTTKYVSQVQPSAPFVNRLNIATQADVWAPKIKATAGLAWTNGGYSASVQARYVGRYLDYQPRPNTNHLGDMAFVDVSAEAPLEGVISWRGLGKDAFVRLSVSNLFDKGLAYSNFSVIGYDPSQADPIGRLATITLGKRF